LICKNCSEEYDVTMFPYCPYCLFEARDNKEEKILNVDESEYLKLEKKEDLKGNINKIRFEDIYEKDTYDNIYSINDNDIKKGFS